MPEEIKRERRLKVLQVSPFWFLGFLQRNTFSEFAIKNGLPLDTTLVDMRLHNCRQFQDKNDLLDNALKEVQIEFLLYSSEFDIVDETLPPPLMEPIEATRTTLLQTCQTIGIGTQQNQQGPELLMRASDMQRMAGAAYVQAMKSAGLWNDKELLQ